MKHLGLLAALLVAWLAFPQPAQAGDDSEHGLGDVGVGLRTGGYGFRHLQGDRLAWDDCRMNGVGAFGTLDFTENLFVELGVDHYYATGETVTSGMDRHSTFMTAAAGARMFPDFFFSPFIQVGGGPEWTKIDVEGHSLNKVTASAFLGLGGEVSIESFHFGMNIRAYSMAHPLHGESADAAHSHLANGEEIEVEQEVAGQVQFFMRFTL